jgi:hypothetical protein
MVDRPIGGSDISRQPNVTPMPEHFMDLLLEDISYPGWEDVYRNRARFVVVNAAPIVSSAHITTQDVARMIPKAEALVQDSAWSSVDLDWTCSPQNQPELVFKRSHRIGAAQRLSKALIVIVATDLAVRDKADNPYGREDVTRLSSSKKAMLERHGEDARTVDVYGQMRVYPLCHYVAGTNHDMLSKARLNPKFLPRFIELAGQEKGDADILKRHAQHGFTLTRYAAEALRQTLIEFGQKDIGDVVFTQGGNAFSRDAPTGINVPKTMTPAEIVTYMSAFPAQRT